MKYKLNNQYLTLIIDNTFNNKTINDLFIYYHLSKKTIYLLKLNKEYSLNNKYVNDDTILKVNDKLTIKAFNNDDLMYIPICNNINIIYEDDFILVVNKPSNLSIYPDSQDKLESLNHYVSYYYMISGYNYPVRPIHRLDVDTTGLVIYCKCSLIQPLLDYRLSIKEIKRYYKAIVEGSLDNKEHTIKTCISRDRHNSKKVRTSNQGKEAITKYKCIKKENNMSLIECSLLTGRKHQIRVHMASIGHPIVGDKLYGNSSKYINRQALHAYKIVMEHPITNETLTIECPLPKDFFINND